jgi:hypothetical protein
MPTVSELSAPYGNFMLGPRRGPDVCSACFNLIDRSGRCYGCERGPGGLDAMAPISYSVGGEQLHHALAGYKRLSGNPARQFQMELAAVLWRYLAAHERCLALAAGVDAFAIVTTVPSSQTERATTHPLPLLVADLVGPARERYVRLLERTGRPAPPHRFSIGKYAAREAGAAHRRYLDHRRQRPERGGGAEGNRRGIGRGRRDRPVRQSRVAP